MASRPDPQVLLLLRGINVGGSNKVPMADLRAALSDAGLHDVRTYIQSGNAIVRTSLPVDAAEETAEAVIADRFGIEVRVTARTHQQLRAVVDEAPPGFGAEPDRFHSDVVFLIRPLTIDEAMAVVRVREEVDQAWAGDRVVYFARLSEQRTRSHLNKVIGTRPYRLMTIRTWSTTTKLLALCDAAEEAAGG